MPNLELAAFIIMKLNLEKKRCVVRYVLWTAAAAAAAVTTNATRCVQDLVREMHAAANRFCAIVLCIVFHI